jgi:hypothetical protein
MVIFIFQIISLICFCVALGIVFTLLSKETYKAQPESAFFGIHQNLVHRFGPAMGIAETGAFITTLILTILYEGHWILFFFSALAGVCIAFMILIWAIWIYPINKRIDLWEADSMPDCWQRVRNRWRRLHYERAAFAFLGMVALIVTVSMG